MKLVLQKAPDIMPYNIIINKLSIPMYEKLHKDPELTLFSPDENNMHLLLRHEESLYDAEGTYTAL